MYVLGHVACMLVFSR